MDLLQCEYLEGSGRLPDNGVVLETVYHVVHVAGARRILKDGRLQAGLIYDESRLNRSRTGIQVDGHLTR